MKKDKSCAHGFFWKGNKKGCIECPTGNYCPSGTGKKPTPCPAGTFNDLIGQWGCTVCPPGNECPEESSIPKACAPGTYNDESGRDLCVKCPVGYHCPIIGNIEPIACPVGTYTDDIASAECKTCPTGHFCTQGTILPHSCPDGAY